MMYNKQFESNEAMDKFITEYIRKNCDISDSFFAKKFGIISDILSYITWDKYAEVIIDAGYNIDNLRSGLCDELVEAYDARIKQK